MSYIIQEDKGKYNVYQDGGNKKPKNKKPMTKAQADSFLAALNEQADKELDGSELLALEAKCCGYDDYYDYHARIDPDDPRAAYDPMGGLSGGKACANCYWFSARNATCSVVWGDIVATGVSKLWMPQEAPEEVAYQDPIPVVIVNPSTEMPTEMGSMARKARFVDSILAIFSKKEEPVADTGFKVYADGRWVGWYSNNAKDLVSEWFSAKSIDSYIARVDKGLVPYPELWFKHLPVRMGKADYLARIGYFSFATGTFFDTPVGERGKAYFLAEQKAGRHKTMSHGFLYPTNMKIKGVYHAHNTFEVSVLDPGEEANSFTLFEVKAMFKALDEQKKADLERIFGKDEAAKLINFGETKSRELEATGVDLKSFEGFPDVELTDQAAQAGMRTLAEATTAGFKKVAEALEQVSAQVLGLEQAGKSNTEAIANLKAFVDEQFSATPRASKANATLLGAQDPQVVQLRKSNADAKDHPTPEAVTPDNTGAKSILELVNEAMNPDPLSTL